MESRGIVVKIKGKKCIVLTPGGEYREVPLPGEGMAAVGREIALPKVRKLPYAGSFMVAASLLIFVLAGLFYPGRPLQAAAYLTIDINPSIELAVSQDKKVLEARGLNTDGERILTEVAVQKRDLREAVELIVARALEDRYLSPEGDNVILATLTVESGAEPLVELEQVFEAVNRPVESGGVIADVIIEPVTPETRQKALESGVSTGRYVLVEKSDQKGLPVSISEVRGRALGALEKEKKVTLIEIMDDDRKINIMGKDSRPQGAVGNKFPEVKPDVPDHRKDEDDNDNKDDKEKSSTGQAKKKGIYVSHKKDRSDKAPPGRAFRGERTGDIEGKAVPGWPGRDNDDPRPERSGGKQAPGPGND